MNAEPEPLKFEYSSPVKRQDEVDSLMYTFGLHEGAPGDLPSIIDGKLDVQFNDFYCFDFVMQTAKQDQ